MKIQKVVCDLCMMDGLEKRAVAWYRANDHEVRDVCRDHLGHVEAAGLEFWMLEDNDEK